MNLKWPNFVVAEDDGAIVGVGQIKSHGDGSRELASIAVVPARQGQGIARAGLEALLSRARAARRPISDLPEGAGGPLPPLRLPETQEGRVSALLQAHDPTRQSGHEA